MSVKTVDKETFCGHTGEGSAGGGKLKSGDSDLQPQGSRGHVRILGAWQFEISAIVPILDVDKAKPCLFVKRSLGSGYAGIDNELFFRDNTMMLFGDAKKMVEDIVKALD